MTDQAGAALESGIAGRPVRARQGLRSRETWAVISLIVALTAMRAIFAGLFDLRTDEAYYWTWSKEASLSFLDHPPMIAWFIRFGTTIFGDTNFGVRFAGLLAMLATQLLLADIVRRVTHDVGAVLLVVLLPEAALFYGLLMAKVAPDVAMIPFAVAMIWSLVRLAETDDARWWLAAGVFAGLAALSKLTVIMLVPAILAFALVVPSLRRRWLRSPYPWLGILIALVLFSPVVIWNAGHDWASFKFQLVRLTADHAFSWLTFGDFIGLQFSLVGPVLLPVMLSALAVTAWRGYGRRDPVAILLSTSVIVPLTFFVGKSLTLRIGDTWPMFMWPVGFAAVAINAVRMREEGFPDWVVRATRGWIVAAIATGIPVVVLAFLYCVACPWNLFGPNDPVGFEAGYGPLASRALEELRRNGGNWIATSDYRTNAMLRWHLRDSVPVIQVNQRARYIGFRDPGLVQIDGRPGIYVSLYPDDAGALLASTSARLERIAIVERVWRGGVMRTYQISRLSGWTPELAPAPDTPFYRWPQLARRRPALVMLAAR